MAFATPLALPLPERKTTTHRLGFTEDIQMGKRDGHQKGPQQHAEGQHGEKTHSAFLEELHGRHGGSEESEGQPQRENQPMSGEPVEGNHRLFEDRQQHDEAEKNSEKIRLAREKERQGETPEGGSLNGPLR
jgi:hypothetical protein